MRAVFMTWLFVVPLTAFAQTPADIARQLWPMGPPISSSVAPSQPRRDAGSFGPSDLARQLWPYGAPSLTGSRAPHIAIYGAGFTVLDLARLRGAPILEQQETPRPFLLARRNLPHD